MKQSDLSRKWKVNTDKTKQCHARGYQAPDVPRPGGMGQADRGGGGGQKLRYDSIMYAHFSFSLDSRPVAREVLYLAQKSD